MKKKTTQKKAGAAAKKSTPKKSLKDRLVDGVARLVKAKKTTQTSSEQKVTSANPHFVNPMMADQDPAHSPGHRRMNVKSGFDSNSGTKTRPQNESALNRMADSDRISRNNMQRRIILQNGK